MQIRIKRDWSAEAEVEGFSSGLVGNLGEIVLAPIHTPKTVAIVAHARRIDRVNDDPRALRFFNGGVHIRVTGSAIPKAIDAVGNHQDLAANRTFWPTLDQVNQGEIAASRCARVSQRKPERFGRLRMVVGGIL